MSNNHPEFYEGLRSQRRALRKVLNDLNDAGFSDRAILDLCGQYISSDRVPRTDRTTGIPSRATLQRLRTAKDVELDRMRNATVAPVYDFLCVCEELPSALFKNTVQIRSAHRLAPFMEAFQKYMGAQTGPFTNTSMKSLEGTFYLYRRAWTSPNVESYIRCILEFEWVGDALFFTERQRYHDTVEDTSWDEIDYGIVLPFSVSVVFLSRGGNKDLLKFFSIHDFSPFPDGGVKVNYMAGNYIAVYAKGPHPGFGLFARRVREGDGEPSCEFYAPGELDPDVVEKIALASGGGFLSTAWR